MDSSIDDCLYTLMAQHEETITNSPEVAMGPGAAEAHMTGIHEVAGSIPSLSRQVKDLMLLGAVV